MNKRPLNNVPKLDGLKFKIGSEAYINEDGARVKVVIVREYPYMILCKKGDKMIGVPKACFLCGDAVQV